MGRKKRTGAQAMNRKFLLVAMGLLVVVVVATIIYTYAQTKFPAFHGSMITPPMPLADFTLTDQNNQTAHLSDWRGKYVVLFFGFTNCPDECPLTMGYLKQMADKLGSLASEVQVVLITSDPARDTPQALGEFLGHFNPSFIGLTSSLSNLQTVWKEFGVTVEANGETHSAYVYLIDNQGNLIATYPTLQNARDITADMKVILSAR
jgi:protein SCO1/2